MVQGGDNIRGHILEVVKIYGKIYIVKLLGLDMYLYLPVMPVKVLALAIIASQLVSTCKCLLYRKFVETGRLLYPLFLPLFLNTAT